MTKDAATHGSGYLQSAIDLRAEARGLFAAVAGLRGGSRRRFEILRPSSGFALGDFERTS